MDGFLRLSVILMRRSLVNERRDASAVCCICVTLLEGCISVRVSTCAHRAREVGCSETEGLCIFTGSNARMELFISPLIHTAFQTFVFFFYS